MNNRKWRKDRSKFDEIFPVRKRRNGHVSAINPNSNSCDYPHNINMNVNGASKHAVNVESLFQSIDRTNHMTLELIKGSSANADVRGTVMVKLLNTLLLLPNFYLVP